MRESLRSVGNIGWGVRVVCEMVRSIQGHRRLPVDNLFVVAGRLCMAAPQQAPALPEPGRLSRSTATREQERHGYLWAYTVQLVVILVL